MAAAPATLARRIRGERAERNTHTLHAAVLRRAQKETPVLAEHCSTRLHLASW